MTTQTFRHNAVQVAHVLTLAPILVAALIGALPLLIPCIAGRCCKEVVQRIWHSVSQQ